MKAFISYSHRDTAALERLHTHLSMLRREGQITEWYDREILAGSDLDSEITAQLESSELFLVLVSPDFLASDYCYDRELRRALERHESGEAIVVPIIVEPCDWKSSPLKQLKALPRDGQPVSEWTNQNNAFLDVVTELRRVVAREDRADEREDAPAPPVRASGSRYRVKREFDEIDRSDFRSKAFEVMRRYFERAVAEVDQIDGVRARYVSTGPLSFTCTLINRAIDHGTAHITVHGQSGAMGFSDIYYSFQENAPTNTANGGFTIESDDYELFLKSGPFGFETNDERLTPEQASALLWTNFLDQAGVSYDD
ncbi:MULTISPECIES: toll/interleukin-1 receptor domain-containing protein [Alphaproteobacteria]|uniref:TIR domain-containing protein n=1 Tax=Acidomonas methanolica NBRC 104435 TaxID=1231351 RepID=A0A023D817_ACIMT|nr:MULTISPECIES: toll/interleukin-1 receptor domain-containing protein [Alphaproteobacteria]TCS23518.1 TIR domain-containing protein [Acidomonas methanolica]GAJ30312.1 hypothetical protein Amme_121_011 [Acidomonas methanolica NBRC 104435]GBQ52230.1 hypothetical protein AA0498_1681 [Acidomonas methanolica]GEK98175.1 hypothetical protein AME01nite_06740 [Acidomonas methanolica NBRC 104435]